MPNSVIEFCKNENGIISSNWQSRLDTNSSIQYNKTSKRYFEDTYGVFKTESRIFYKKLIHKSLKTIINKTHNISHSLNECTFNANNFELFIYVIYNVLFIITTKL